jgi:crotonobetainyl-CoA:carnitine CoA-transferase CaiB-like acyl-CoA transferase
VEICHSVAGPFAGSVLAQLGAEVVKVENPDGGDHARGWGPPYWHGTSAAFQALNRDKRGITSSLRDADQVGRLKRLILRKADIVLQNMRPGSIETTGISGPDLRELKPSLIYCNLGAFGAKGPLAMRPGYDPLMQAFGGIMSVTGVASGEPVRVGPAVVDIGSGMWAVIGILAALHRRGVTGQGCIVDTSLYETAVAWMTIPIVSYLASGRVGRGMGSAIAEIVPHQAFRTSDGFIMVAAGNDRLFAALCNVLGHPEWADDPAFATNDARVRNRERLIPMIEKIFAALGKAEWSERLDGGGVPYAPIQTVEEVAAHPQTSALGLIQQAPDRDMRLVGLPLSFDGTRTPFLRSAPALGQDVSLIDEEEPADFDGTTD